MKIYVTDYSFRFPSFLCREIMFGELDRSFVNVSNLWLVSLVLIIIEMIKTKEMIHRRVISLSDWHPYQSMFLHAGVFSSTSSEGSSGSSLVTADESLSPYFMVSLVSILVPDLCPSCGSVLLSFILVLVCSILTHPSLE